MQACDLNLYPLLVITCKIVENIRFLSRRMCNSIRQATVICMLFSFILVKIMGQINASVCELVFQTQYYFINTLQKRVLPCIYVVIINLVDSASSHTLVSKIKPCMSKYKYFTVKLQMAHYNSHSLFDNPLLLDNCSNSRANTCINT